MGILDSHHSIGHDDIPPHGKEYDSAKPLMRVENGNEQSIEMRNSSDRMMAPHSARDDGWDNSPENTRKFDLSSNLAQVKRD